MNDRARQLGIKLHPLKAIKKVEVGNHLFSPIKPVLVYGHRAEEFARILLAKWKPTIVLGAPCDCEDAWLVEVDNLAKAIEDIRLLAPNVGSLFINGIITLPEKYGLVAGYQAHYFFIKDLFKKALSTLIFHDVLLVIHSHPTNGSFYGIQASLLPYFDVVDCTAKDGAIQINGKTIYILD